MTQAVPPQCGKGCCGEGRMPSQFQGVSDTYMGSRRMRSQVEGAAVRLFQGEGTAFAALQKPEYAEGRGWRKVGEQDRARALPACFDTISPTMQPRSHHCIVCICGVCNGRETLNASLKWCSEAHFLRREDPKSRHNPILYHIFQTLSLKLDRLRASSLDLCPEVP